MNVNTFGLGYLMYHRIYLDTHFIDYLFDHRRDIWEGRDDALNAAEAARVGDNQLDEFSWLRMMPPFCWLNNWWLRIGTRVMEQLNTIKDPQRRNDLVEYALQIAEQEWLDAEVDAGEGETGTAEEASIPRDPRQYSFLRELGFEDDYPPPEEVEPLWLPPRRLGDASEYPRSPA